MKLLNKTLFVIARSVSDEAISILAVSYQLSAFNEIASPFGKLIARNDRKKRNIFRNTSIYYGF